MRLTVWRMIGVVSLLIMIIGVPARLIGREGIGTPSWWMAFLGVVVLPMVGMIASGVQAFRTSRPQH